VRAAVLVLVLAVLAPAHITLPGGVTMTAGVLVAAAEVLAAAGGIWLAVRSLRPWFRYRLRPAGGEPW
jgi:hypothetical protein